MQVAEVHFNHDPLNHVGDALTIRHGYSQGRVIAPEWLRGQRADPVAYASKPLGSKVTIKVRFTGGPPGETVTVRAVDADSPPGPNGCLGLIIKLLLIILGALKGNVMGQVAAQSVAFNATGASALIAMTLSKHRLNTCGVGEFTTRWRWEYDGGEGWTQFDTTSHTVFVVLDTPRPPWSQQMTPEVIAFAAGPEVDLFFDNNQLPWVSALKVACAWAHGAKTKHEAASEVTQAVNSETPHSYDTHTQYGGFGLSWYLEDLALGSPVRANCTDCANAVTVLSNLLGCDLWAQYLSTPFDETKPFLTLNGDANNPADWVTYSWSYHEFGWIGASGPSGKVYDACLQVDMDDDPDDTVHVAQHPLSMPFTTYKPRLWDKPTGLRARERRRVY